VSSDAVPGSTADALGMLDRALDVLNGPGRDTAPRRRGTCCGGWPGSARSTRRPGCTSWPRSTPATGHDADGFPTTPTWLAARAEGVTLIDLRNLAALLIETWRTGHGHPDTGNDDGFRDRHLQLDLTLGGAGRLTGDLTPECGAAVRAVIQALGKRRGKEDTRTANQRYHDALQQACELLIRAKMVPDRAGSDTHVDVHVALGELLNMDGASVLTEAWLRARSGEEGYLFGDDARAVACDALIVPVVTGSPDWDVVGEMIGVVLDAFGWHDDDTAAAETPAAGAAAAGAAAAGAGAAGAAGGRRSAPLPPEAWQALQYALARLAVRFLSGPGGLASVLRTGLLPVPYNTRSLPLDVGVSDRIPEAIRRAVILRDGHCAWGGCDRPPAECDVHHVQHRKDGGPTSAEKCALFCDFHHDICIHRWGWEVELLPDGSVKAVSPDGRVVRSHAPPPPQAA
jgi:hypothetical protein